MVTAVPLIAGIQAQLAQRADRPPKIAPGEFLKTALEIQALSERGLVPVLSVDPFTGGTVLSTQDQLPGLFNLLGESFATASLAGTPEESAALLGGREEFIESRRIGTPPVTSTPTLRDQVVAALSTSTGKLAGPGIVDKKSSSLSRSRRLGGPCAGANTGFMRLNCARGGFS